MIGLSVSKCVLDIALGKVAIEVVEKIIGNTCCTSEVMWDSLIKRYRKKYWQKNADECERVARILIAGEKIEQPRLTKKMIPCITMGHWVAREDEIEWFHL